MSSDYPTRSFAACHLAGAKPCTGGMLLSLGLLPNHSDPDRLKLAGFLGGFSAIHVSLVTVSGSYAVPTTQRKLRADVWSQPWGSCYIGEEHRAG